MKLLIIILCIFIFIELVLVCLICTKLREHGVSWDMIAHILKWGYMPNTCERCLNYCNQMDCPHRNESYDPKRIKPKPDNLAEDALYWQTTMYNNILDLYEKANGNPFTIKVEVQHLNKYDSERKIVCFCKRSQYPAIREKWYADIVMFKPDDFMHWATSPSTYEYAVLGVDMESQNVLHI